MSVMNKYRAKWGLSLMFILWSASYAAAQEADQAPVDVERAMAEAAERGDVPGAVLLWGMGDRPPQVVTRGHLATHPKPTALAPDAIYDLASLTKPIATATSILILVDRGQVKLDEPVATYLPAFGNHGKEAITVEQLLTHHSGLIPDTPIADYADGGGPAMKKIMQLEPRWEPGTAFKYSDVNFQVLGVLVEAVDGRRLDRFARQEIFEPLGMDDTRFLPPKRLHRRIAPTTQRDGRWVIGEVHDPRAFAMDGVAGHAGLFGTAEDVGRWVRMVLNGGELDGKRILSEQVVRDMLTPRATPEGDGLRGLGVDIDTGFSKSPRGSRFAVGTTLGHTGYTGGCFWADPQSGAYYVLLTNRVHPDDSGKVSALRRAVATAVAVALLGPEVAEDDESAAVLTGIDVLQRDGFALLRGKKIAIATNHTGVDRDGRRIIDLLVEAPDVQVVRLFSPEHGLFGKVDEKVGHGTDPATGLPVFSLYGETRKPDAQMMAGLDAVVFDIQDIGVRFYTYIATMGLVMEAAAEHGVAVVVLDRPNPINGVDVQGPVTDEGQEGFTAFSQIALRHGMTVGELAGYFNREHDIRCDLTVVPMEGWRRDMWYDQTGLWWINPSPNMRNLTQAALYPAIGLIESGQQVSVGRGTDQPFELFGAPWIEGRKFAAMLNAAAIPGLRFVPVKFTPTVRHFKGQECGGVYVMVTDREVLDPVAAGLRIAWTLEHLFPESYDLDTVNNMIKDAAAMQALTEAQTWPDDIAEVWTDELEAFKQRREKYLLYK